MADDDWDLHAVVRGCHPSAHPPATPDPFSSFPLLPSPAGESVDFINLLAPSCTADVPVLEELCRPFYRQPQQQQQPQPQQQLQHPHVAAVVPPTTADLQRPRQPHRPLSAQISGRSKRRKNQQKRMVCQVAADGTSGADMWAWRKYGQKPIKGSPYPRGYYKCSSSKGCPARKQVERSPSEPGMLVVTYTAEHNHPIPAHRNSLAGSTRQKVPSVSTLPPPPAAAGGVLSPTTPLTGSMEECKSGEEEEEEEGSTEEGVLLVEDMEVMDEDDVLFLGGSTAETGGANVGGFDEHMFPSPWLGGGNNNAAAAAGGS